MDVISQSHKYPQCDDDENHDHGYLRRWEEKEYRKDIEDQIDSDGFLSWQRNNPDQAYVKGL